MPAEISHKSVQIPVNQKGGSRLNVWWRQATPYIFISPFYILFLLFGLIPILFSVVVSLTDWRGVRVTQFVGLANYIDLFNDPKFYKALWNTLYIWVGSVPTMIFLAILFAVLINSKTTFFRSLFRTVYFLPIVTSLVVTGLIFGQLFSQSFGMVNNVLVLFGVKPINWLAEPTLMKLILILALLWRWVGNDMVIMLAGLQSIPTELFEAAHVDGANEQQVLFRITIPLLRPVILFDLIISTIGTFNLFAEPYTLFGGAEGGVRQAALVTGTYLYQNSFVFSKFGYGAAMAWVLAVIVFLLSLLQYRISDRASEV
jgi:cellobiose transport system permease protein